MAQIGSAVRALAAQPIGAQATALKRETEAERAPAARPAAQAAARADAGLAFKPAGSHRAEAPAKPAEADLRAAARLRGYQGDACGECGNFTLVRNGTCLKCDTCGSTTGCS
jgi:ribonucleoside-diphosphate reductase alpha chain